jgi:hypothetical protein
MENAEIDASTPPFVPWVIGEANHGNAVILAYLTVCRKCPDTQDYPARTLLCKREHPDWHIVRSSTLNIDLKLNLPI